MTSKKSIDSVENNNKKADKTISAQEEFEVRSNLVGFFSLLLKIDRRINKNLYKQ